MRKDDGIDYLGQRVRELHRQKLAASEELIRELGGPVKLGGPVSYIRGELAKGGPGIIARDVYCDEFDTPLGHVEVRAEGTKFTIIKVLYPVRSNLNSKMAGPSGGEG